jgi:hypothetical protein
VGEKKDPGIFAPTIFVGAQKDENKKRNEGKG